MMKAAVVYESLTGNTRQAGELIAAHFRSAGVEAVAFPTTAIDYQALSEADLVVVGTWTDGVVIVGTQRPGRAGRLRRLPWVSGKRCIVYCTYAVHPGRTLEKLAAIVQERGGDVIGGMAIKRGNLSEGSAELVDRALSVLST